MESVISNLEFGGGGGKFGVENAISKFLIWGGVWGGKCYLESRIWGVENLGRKMLSRISNLGVGKFGAENAISNLVFGVENLGWKVLSRISNLGGGGKFGVENAISKFLIWGVENLGWKMLSRISNLGGGKFRVENAISNLEFGGWKIWGGKCYLES